MDIKKANKIINDYGKVMEKSAHMIFGAPISMLPYSREDIKEAIKLAIMLSGPNDDINTLIIAYTNLSKYVDDKKASIAILGQDVIQDENKRKDIIKNNTGSRNYEFFTEANRVHEETIQEHKKLLHELKPTLDYFFKSDFNMDFADDNTTIKNGDRTKQKTVELYPEALKLVIENKKATSAFLQRKLQINYAVAAGLIDMLESNGIIGPHDGTNARKII